MTYEELFIEAMENAGLCHPERDENGNIDVEETINSYEFEAGCSCGRSGAWMSLKNILRAIQDAGLDQVGSDDY